MIGNTTDFIAFAGQRGVIIDPAEAPMLLQSATDYLNIQPWIGDLADPVQEDSWPRINFTSPGGAFVYPDGSIVAIDKGTWIAELTPASPRAVINAVYQLGMAAVDTDLMPTGGRAATTRETVGPITVEYAESTVGAEVGFQWWDFLLGAFLLDDGMSGCNVDVFRG